MVQEERERMACILLTTMAAALSSAPMLLVQTLLFACGPLRYRRDDDEPEPEPFLGPIWEERFASIAGFSSRLYAASALASAGALLLAVLHLARYREALMATLWPGSLPKKRAAGTAAARHASRAAVLSEERPTAVRDSRAELERPSTGPRLALDGLREWNLRGVNRWARDARSPLPLRPWQGV